MTEIRYARKPTPEVLTTMELLCILFEKRPVSLKSDSPQKPKQTALRNFNSKAPAVNPNDPQGYFELARTELLQNPQKLLDLMDNYDRDNIKETVVE